VLTKEEKQQMQQEALSRAVCGQSLGNWPAIIHGFLAKGIAEGDIRPRENVFTYHAWRALGRQVRRGEHGVKVTTYITPREDDKQADPEKPADLKRMARHSRPWTATVFHVSQTEPIA
jgi:hypothetical protein